jgi:plasmid stabilization system protein ParE
VKRVVFHVEAEAELSSAAARYETHRSGLGLEFIVEVERATRALVSYPKIGHRFSRRLRRVLVRRFPYGLLYRIDADAIRIVAVAHVRRRPGYWRHR